MKFFFMTAGWILIALLSPPPSHAGPGIGDLGFDPSVITGGGIPPSLANALVATAGAYTCHRPYQGATSIFSYNSFDMYVEATMIKVGSKLPDALAANGMDNSAVTKIPALPMAKVHIRKAFSDRLDIGVSGISYKGQTAYGGDLKIVLADPEEGPSYALRLGYTYFNVPKYYTSGNTFNPEFVMSRKLNFAEPYLGTGFRYTTGTVAVSYTASGNTVSLPKITGSGTDEYFFSGILFRILGAQGLRLGIEGAYSLGGFSTIGMIFGMGF